MTGTPFFGRRWLSVGGDAWHFRPWVISRTGQREVSRKKQGSVESSQHPVAVGGAEEMTPQEAAARQLGEAVVQDAGVREWWVVSRQAVSADVGNRQEEPYAVRRRRRSGVEDDEQLSNNGVHPTAAAPFARPWVLVRRLRGRRG